MAQRKRRQTQLADFDTPVIPPITDAPGAEADASVLAAHYQRVQDAFACYSYDNCVAVCRWCLDEAPLPFPEPFQRGTRKYCSRRCADAYAAYKAKYYRKGRATVSDAVPSDSDETVDDSYDPPPDMQPDDEAEEDFPPEPSDVQHSADTSVEEYEGSQTG